MTERERLRQWVQESKSTVFLGGAGVSTASGIPDFRSAHGLYQQKKQGLSYEEMLSHGYFVRHTAEFYDFLRGVMLYPDAKPNGAHYALAQLERQGKLRAVITQNIDGLHQMAGSRNVLELHGSENRYTCLACGKRYDMTCVTQTTGVPRCACGGTIRPDVVLYRGEPQREGLAPGHPLCGGGGFAAGGGHLAGGVPRGRAGGVCAARGQAGHPQPGPHPL